MWYYIAVAIYYLTRKQWRGYVAVVISNWYIMKMLQNFSKKIRLFHWGYYLAGLDDMDKRKTVCPTSKL